MKGKNMGSHGRGARKKGKGSGHRGGIGMSGSGKRADHKKTLITKKFGHTYFGKKGFTSRGTKRDTRKRINVGDLQLHLDVYAKKTPKGYEIVLKDYKILGSGEVKDSLFITAFEASSSAIEKVQNAKGIITLLGKKENSTSSSEQKLEKA